MLNKRIANIVFYKVPNGAEEVKQATIFYSDGTVANVNFDEGIDACEQIVQERHIKTKDAFKEMINREIVHVVSAKEFRENFYRFVPEVVEEVRDQEDVMQSTGVQTPVEAHNTESRDRVIPIRSNTAENSTIASGNTEVEAEDEEEVVASRSGDIDNADVHEEVPEDELEDSHEEVATDEREHTVDPAVAASVAGATALGAAAVPNASYRPGDTRTPVSTDASDSSDPVASEEEVPVEEEEREDRFDGSDDFDSDIEDAEVIENREEPAKKEGFFKRAWRKIKESKLVKRVALCVTALAVALGIYSCTQRKSLEGEMYNSNIPGITDITDDNTDNNTFVIDGVTYDEAGMLLQDELVLDTHFYDDATINSLLNATQNQTQKTAMYNLGLAMDGFNNEFASHYIEEGKDIRAALKFEEVVALQVAYNDYSKEELKAYFNGADIRAEDLTRAYKDGSLQLMGAYAMEDPEHPVDMSMLIESEEGKAFYQRYHDKFLAAKTATGDEKIQLVTEFYQMVRDDFPISQQVRTEGISHAQNYDELEAYKLSVAPMIAAAEMMWQNLDIDVTLNDGEIDFINDLGLCNFAQKTFERAELISLTSEVDKNNPTYEQYKEAFIKYYKDKGIYYIDDAHRELTELQAFQDAVNWHFEEGEWVWSGQTWTTTETHQEVSTHTETETHTWEETTVTPVDEADVPEAERERLRDEIDAEIERENEEARRRAEEEAEAERQRLQAIEDQHAAEVEQEVLQDEQHLQETIDDINEQIEENQDDNPQNDQPINEHDYEGIDFDDDHSDEQGNLDPSVENITTDPTGDMTDQPLPDPNDTGREFDAQVGAAEAPAQEDAPVVVEAAPVQEEAAPAHEEAAPVQEEAPAQSFVEEEEPVVTTYSDDQWVETVPVADDYYSESAWVEEDTPSYEEAVDNYVESLADSDNVEEEAMEYTR